MIKSIAEASEGEGGSSAVCIRGGSMQNFHHIGDRLLHGIASITALHLGRKLWDKANN